MAAPIIPVSTEENLRDPIDIRMDIIHPKPVDVVAFPTAAVVRTQAQHGEAIRGIQEHLLGVLIQEELTALRFKVDITESENVSLRARIKTTEAIEKIIRNRARQARIKIEQQLAVAISAIEMLWEWRGIANMDFIQLGGGNSRVDEMILVGSRVVLQGRSMGGHPSCNWVYWGGKDGFMGKTLTTVSQGMSVEEIEQVVAQRVANAIEAIAIYETKTNMARKPMSQTKREEDKVAENASNKRKWERNHNGSSSQQNKRHKVPRAHATRPIKKKAYAGSLPLCNQCKFHPNRPCTVKCGNYKKVGHITLNCRTPTTARNQRTLTCYKKVGHITLSFELFSNYCLNLRF
ncbi:hypothetical protein Tco_0563999 [Tanacetum coccineum]